MARVAIREKDSTEKNGLLMDALLGFLCEALQGRVQAGNVS
jgi:hypothetical protein